MEARVLECEKNGRVSFGTLEHVNRELERLTLDFNDVRGDVAERLRRDEEVCKELERLEKRVKEEIVAATERAQSFAQMEIEPLRLENVEKIEGICEALFGLENGKMAGKDAQTIKAMTRTMFLDSSTSAMEMYLGGGGSMEMSSSSTLVPPTAFGSSIHEFLPDYLTPVLALAELARRCVWGFFRLENEHISNAFMHRREGNSVPSHLRRAPKKEPNKRALSIVEAVAIALLVITLLTRMTLAKKDAEYHLHHDHAPNDGVPNATLAPRAADDDDALRVYDDAAVHHHHHSGHHSGVSFDDDDDSVPKAAAFDDDDDHDVAAAAPTFNYR